MGTAPVAQYLFQLAQSQPQWQVSGTATGRLLPLALLFPFLSFSPNRLLNNPLQRSLRLANQPQAQEAAFFLMRAVAANLQSDNELPGPLLQFFSRECAGRVCDTWPMAKPRLTFCPSRTPCGSSSAVEKNVCAADWCVVSRGGGSCGAVAATHGFAKSLLFRSCRDACFR